MLSPDELQERLKQAADAVQEAKVPEDLRVVAFEHALDALGVGAGAAAPAAATATLAARDQEQQPPPDQGTGAQTRGASGRPAEGMVERIATALSLDRDLVGRIYDEEDGQVRLIVKRTMLPEVGKKAASMRHVALLVVVGRQAAGRDEYTPYGMIREECRELRVYDGPNFATEVGKLEFRTKGGRNTKEARANRHHYDEVSDLIRRMTGEGES
jgi:hypothetical protein